MVSTLLVVLMALAAAYIFLLIYIKSATEDDQSRFQVVGPLLMLKTQRGKKTIDKLAKKRGVGIVADAFVAITILAGALMLILVVYQNTLLFTHTEIVAQNPPQLEQTLAIPGVNPVIPIGYGLFALLVALVIHEGGHGVLARHADMEVRSLGLLFFVIPIGAFVEPNETDLQDARLRDKLRLFSAGPGPNIVLSLVCVVAFSQIFVPAMAPAHDGVAVMGVVEDRPADRAGLEAGMFITAIDGQPVETHEDFQEILAHRSTTSLPAGAKFTGIGDDPGPLSYNLTVPDDAQPGTYTITGRYQYLGADDAFQRAPNSTVEVTCPGEPDGDGSPTRTGDEAFTRQAPTRVPCGATVTVTITLQAPSETRYWTVVEEVPEGWETDALTGGLTGQRLDVTVWHQGQTSQKPVQPLDKFQYYDDEAPQLNNASFRGVPFLGINPAGPEQLGGLVDNLQHPFETQGIARGSLFYIAMPFAGIQPFPGYFHDVYEPSGVFSDWGDGYWVTANTLYWLFWINVVLGTFNALPFWVLDGGHMFRQSLHWTLRRRKGIDTRDLEVISGEEQAPHYVARDPLVQLRLDEVDQQAGAISKGVTITMLVLILAPLIVPQFL